MNRQDLKQILSSKFDFAKWKELLGLMFPKVDFFTKAIPVDTGLAKAGGQVGTIRLDDGRSLGLFLFEVAENIIIARNRKGLRDIAIRYVDQDIIHGALVLYYSDNQPDYRLTFVSKQTVFNEDGAIETKTTAPKRYTFLLGSNEPCTTAANRLIELIDKTKKSSLSIADVQEAFSIEALTKEFYGKLYNWYQWAVDSHTGVTFPNNIDTDQDDRENVQIKIIRLITRMLFVWFIKQKHLVPDNLFDSKFLKTILKEFDPKSLNNGDYYNAILQNLFFATLNQEIEGRKLFNTYNGRSSYYSNKQLYRDTDNSYFSFSPQERERRILNLFKDVPYLNGGLFECLDKYELDDNGKLKLVSNYDGFSHESIKSPNGNFKKKAFVPNALFFAPEHRETVTTKVSDSGKPIETTEIVVMGLIELFQMYNFTVEENTTSDKEVSLDPELLGRVFENLLAAYNPETKESARKSTGSFYTPREIVDYMVEESLIAYLSGQCEHNADEIRQLVMYENKCQVTNPQKLISDLKEIKILDPACGSGAFPMGILLKITDIIERLTPTGNFNRYETKLDIIKNCIYGIDIQPIAMLICKLRFFISLICDCDKDASKQNFGITPLPNLETKFVAANSLLPAKVKAFDNDWTRDPHLQQLQKELLDLRLGIFDKRTHEAKKNNKIKDREKCREIEAYVRQTIMQPNEEKIAMLEKQIAEDESQLQFYEGECWVDEVAQPQTSLFEETNLTPTIFRHDVNKEKRETLQTRIRKSRNEIEIERTKSALPGFETAVQEITKWDPYDQNAVSPFFDAEWMFGMGGNNNSKQGFDIVIGNPPYINFSKHKDLNQLYEQCGYSTFDKNGDIYCLFYECGWQLLKNEGHLCYITSNKWMRAGYGKKMRGFLDSKTNPMLLIDFAGIKVFESATVDTNILLFSKDSNIHQTYCAIANRQNVNSIKNLSLFVQQQGTICGFNGDESWVVLSPIEQSIKRKIEAVGTPLKDWDIRINYGIKTGCNEAFIITTEKRDEILSNCKSEVEREKTAELIRPILRGRDIKRYSYNWAGLWLINTHNGVRGSIPRIDIENYPAIKQYLDNYWDELSRRADKGDTPYNLRNCAYLEDFFQPKIIWAELARTGNAFVFDNSMKAVGNTGYILTNTGNIEELYYLLGFLNSKIILFYLDQITSRFDENGWRWLRQFVEQLRVPKYTGSSIISNLAMSTNHENQLSNSTKLNKLVAIAYGLDENEIDYIEEYLGDY